MVRHSVGAPRTIVGRRQALLRWYRMHGRHHLPWRHTRDPYAILVSEIMLQQTQVDRVIPYWSAWMRRWSTIAALARARRSDVIRAWAGLGYNRRAVYLHRLAQEVTRRRDASTSFSFSYEKEKGVSRWARDLQRFPGIGPYTANALLAFAWNLPAPCIDTNIRRVLAHVIYRRAAIARYTDRQIERCALRVIPRGRGRDWNYALMDYGALVFRATDVPGRTPRRVSAFTNSPRFWRGRIVAALRERRRPVTYVGLRRAIARYGDPPRVLTPLLHALERDGVIARDGGRYALA